MIAFSALAAALAVAAPQWSTPVQISTGDRALGPELAMNSAGDAIVVWDQEVGALCPTMPANPACIHIVELAERPSNTSPWEAPIELNRPGIGSRPRAAIDANGDAAVMWVHDIGVPRVVQATYRRGPTGAWPNPNDLSEYVLGVLNHDVVLSDDGTAYAAWAQLTDTGVVARYEVRRAGIWGASTRLSDVDVLGGPALSAVAPSSSAEVAWAEPTRVVVAGLPGVANPTEVTPTAGSTLAGDPDVAVNGGTAVVFTATPASGNVLTEAALCCGAGYTWPTTKIIGQARDAAGATPQVGTNGRSAVAVWDGPTGPQAADGSITDGTWSRVTTLARDAEGTDPRVAVDANGNAVAVWIGGTETVQAAIRPAATRSWLPPVTLSAAGASSPRIAIDSAGNAVAVWNRASGDLLSVESSQLSATGPILQQFAAPKLGRARLRLAFSVRPVPWAATLSGLPVWSFGDGKIATGLRVTHAYARPGRYKLTVTQADAAGATAAATAQIRIVKRAHRS